MFAKLKFLASSAWEFLKPKIMLLLSKAGPIIIAIVVEAVKAAAGQKGLSNDEKKQYAMEFAKDRLTTAGVSMAASMLDGLVQDAYTATYKSSP